MINFTRGFVKAGDIFINPDQIRTVSKTEDGKAMVQFDSLDYEYLKGENVKPHDLLTAAVKAQNQGGIIDVQV